MALDADAASGQAGTDGGEWRWYAGDGGHTQYTPLDQIDRSNVGDLEIAWIWEAESSGRPVRDFQSTPLMIGGTLYTTTGASEVAAVDAETGETLWLFTPEPRPGEPPPEGPGRGVAYWTDGTVERLFHNVMDGRLVALDPRTGAPVEEFGEGGYVDLAQRIGPPDAQVRPLSAPIVAKGVVASTVIPGDEHGKRATPGHVQGFDVRTGERRWIFHVVPQEGEFGSVTWEDGSASYTGNAGVWTQLAVDEDLGYLYLPTETPTNDFYGGDRLGDNLFANSIVALDMMTGERVWHFQITHHDIWDYDLPAPPTLLDVVHDGVPVKAVAVLTKQGFVFTFDRVTGEPLWPIVEMPVPQSDVPGERTSLTQPIPSRPAPFERQGFTYDELIDLTPELRTEAMEIAGHYRLGSLYAPGSLLDDPDGTQGTIILPGWGGGANWLGASVDIETGVLFIPSVSLPILVALDEGGRADDPDASAYVRVGSIYPPDPRGLPLVKPPWGRITAIDMNTGEHLWTRPNGPAPRDVREHPDLQGLGLDFSSMGQNSRVGTLVTSTLLFAGEGGGVRGGAGSRYGAGGPGFRAYDKLTGELVAEITLPVNPTAPPMSYMLNGKQYIVMPGATLETNGKLIALALPNR